MAPYHSQPVRTLLRRPFGRRYDAAHPLIRRARVRARQPEHTSGGTEPDAEVHAMERHPCRADARPRRLPEWRRRASEEPSAEESTPASSDGGGGSAARHARPMNSAASRSPKASRSESQPPSSSAAPTRDLGLDCPVRRPGRERGAARSRRPRGRARLPGRWLQRRGRHDRRPVARRRHDDRRGHRHQLLERRRSRVRDPERGRHPAPVAVGDGAGPDPAGRAPAVLLLDRAQRRDPGRRDGGLRLQRPGRDDRRHDP